MTRGGYLHTESGETHDVVAPSDAVIFVSSSGATRFADAGRVRAFVRPAIRRARLASAARLPAHGASPSPQPDTCAIQSCRL